MGLWNNIKNAGSIATDAIFGGIGIAADIVVSLTWDNLTRHGVNYFRDDDNKIEPVGFGTCAEGLINAKKYAWDNPKRAGALAGQGLVNSVTSISGLAGDVIGQVPDIADNILWDWTFRNVANLAYDDDNKIKQRSFVSWGGCTEFLTKHSQFIKPPSEYILDKDGEKIRGSNGEFIRNSNVNAERTILYVTQGIGEIATFVAVFAGTAGVGGAALATTRIGAASFRSLFKKSTQEVTKNLPRLTDSFKKAAKWAVRWSSPIIGRTQKARELTEKATRLTRAAEKAKALGKVNASKIFEKATKTKTRAGKITTEIAARKALGKGSGLTTGTWLIVPELAGLQMAIHIFLSDAIALGKSAIAQTDAGESINRETTHSNIVDFLDIMGIKPGSEKFNTTLHRLNILPRSEEYNKILEKLEEKQRSETNSSPDTLAKKFNEPPQGTSFKTTKTAENLTLRPPDLGIS